MNEILTVTRVSSNVKNAVAVLLAWYFAGQPAAVWPLFLTFVALSCVSSAFYAYNALTDRAQDAVTPNKRANAAAARLLGGRALGSLVAILAGVGILVALWVNTRVAALAGFLGLTMFAYSSPATRLKERVGTDVLTGALLTHPLRFAAAWAALRPELSPLLPLVALGLAKGGGYLLYKNLDRDTLQRLGVRSTVTALAHRQVVLLGLVLLGLAVIAVLGMAANHANRLPWLGALPPRALWLLLAGVPPVVVMILRHFGVRAWSTARLRRAGLVYQALCLAAAVWLLM